MEEKKKGNIGFIIAIVLLVLLVLGLVFYICYDKGILFKVDNASVEEKNEDKVEEKVTSSELSYNEANLLMEKIKVLNDNLSNYYPLNNVSDIDNEDLLLFVADKVGFGTSFTETTAEDIIKTYLGSNVELKHENIMCDTDNKPYYVYDSAAKTYTYDSMSHGHGGGGRVYAETYYVDGTSQSDGKIVVNAKVLYSNYCSDTCIIHAYYTSPNNQQNPVIGGDFQPIEFTDDTYKNVEDKVPVTTYTFTKDKSGVYNLESVKTN